MSGTSKAQKQALAESLWLSYFNNYLYAHGLITEQEHSNMSVRIALRHGAKKQQGA